ncbi:MAG: SAM-dependent methyltransferase [Rubrivivax sp.]
MTLRTLQVDEPLFRYLLEHSLREHPAQAALREATRTHPHAGMQISPDQGQFMALLVKLMGAKRTIEIGTFTGYSALTVALALPDDGRLLACDVSDEYTRVGRPFWQRAGVAHKIELVLGGLIAFDNTLWNGAVARPAADDDTRALQALNERLHHDERVDLALLTVGDGLTLARKR